MFVKIKGEHEPAPVVGLLKFLKEGGKNGKGFFQLPHRHDLFGDSPGVYQSGHFILKTTFLKSFRELKGQGLGFCMVPLRR